MDTAVLEYNKPEWKQKSEFYKLTYLRSLARALEQREELNDNHIRVLRKQYKGAVTILNRPLCPQYKRLQWFSRCTFHLN